MDSLIELELCQSTWLDFSRACDALGITMTAYVERAILTITAPQDLPPPPKEPCVKGPSLLIGHFEAEQLRRTLPSGTTMNQWAKAHLLSRLARDPKPKRPERRHTLWLDPRCTGDIEALRAGFEVAPIRPEWKRRVCVNEMRGLLGAGSWDGVLFDYHVLFGAGPLRSQLFITYEEEEALSKAENVYVIEGNKLVPELIEHLLSYQDSEDIRLVPRTIIRRKLGFDVRSRPHGA